MAELADAADSKSCGRAKRLLSKCSFFFVFQHIRISREIKACCSVSSCAVPFWPDGYSLATAR